MYLLLYVLLMFIVVAACVVVAGVAHFQLDSIASEERRGHVFKGSFKNIGQARPLLVYFCPFFNTMANIAHHLTINGKIVDGLLGILSQGHKIVDEDESNELWKDLNLFS